MIFYYSPSCEGASRIESLLMGVREHVWRKRRQASLRHLTCLQQPGSAGAVGSRPGTPGATRSEAPRVRLLVNTLECTIDPAKAKRLFHRIVVGNSGLPVGLFVVDQPDLLVIPVVFG